jgi:endoplasmic reticulum junction formation protein lunapark
VDTLTQRLEAQQTERIKTIEKLKAATKYDSTQQLLEKYGGATPKPKPERKSLPANLPTKAPKNFTKQPPRTSLGPPPPTANIQRPALIQSQPSTPQAAPKPPVAFAHPSPIIATPQAEFAPNAFTASQQYATGDTVNLEAHWYDRVLDLLLGEDETAAKNRMVLICPNCRLVNGQAPPGTKALAELGKWRCFGCGTMNGEEDEAAKAVKEMQEIIKGKKGDEATVAENKANSEPAVDENGDARGDDSEIEPDIEQDIVEKGTSSDSDTVEVKPNKGRPKSNRKRRS